MPQPHRGGLKEGLKKLFKRTAARVPMLDEPATGLHFDDVAKRLRMSPGFALLDRRGGSAASRGRSPAKAEAANRLRRTRHHQAWLR